MRTMTLLLVLTSVLLLATSPMRASTKPPNKEEHPGEVALINYSGNWSYRHFPSNLALYTYDRDSPGKSACTDEDGCSGAWPPLIAPADAKPLGDWTIITRADTRRQWAYLGHPVYLRYHDSVESPTGNGVDGVWHILEP